MADITYRIIIEQNASGQSGGMIRQESPIAKTVDGEDSKNPLSEFLQQGKSVRKMAPVVYAKKFAEKTVTTLISRIDARTGNIALQQRLDFCYNTTKSLLDAGGLMLGGIATANPMAVVAGAISLTTMGINMAIEQENININRRVENVGMNMANIRAGAGGDRNGRS